MIERVRSEEARRGGSIPSSIWMITPPVDVASAFDGNVGGGRFSSTICMFLSPIGSIMG
jgi:hypothetical protein